jgi:hypothetical protein
MVPLANFPFAGHLVRRGGEDNDPHLLHPARKVIELFRQHFGHYFLSGLGLTATAKSNMVAVMIVAAMSALLTSYWITLNGQDNSCDGRERPPCVTDANAGTGRLPALTRFDRVAAA